MYRGLGDVQEVQQVYWEGLIRRRCMEVRCSLGRSVVILGGWERYKRGQQVYREVSRYKGVQEIYRGGQQIYWGLVNVEGNQ